MSTPKKNTYLDLSDKASGGGHPIHLFWAETQPDRIHLAINDPRLVDGDGEKPGLRLVFSSNPKSADYSPANYNRCARVLRDLSMPAPADDVPEYRRHLKEREWVTAEILGAGSGADSPALAVPGEAEHCGKCLCYVSNLEQHDAIVHN